MAGLCDFVGFCESAGNPEILLEGLAEAFRSGKTPNLVELLPGESNQYESVVVFHRFFGALTSIIPSDGS